MKVACFAPRVGSATGVADYAAALHRELQKHVQLVETGEDLALYHLGNNPVHNQIYARALVKPGVILLHDGVLNHFFLGMFDRETYVNEFAHNYGSWTETFAEQLWNQRASSATDPRYFAYPMTRRIAEISRAVLVHNPAAARSVRAHAPQAHTVEVPHFFSLEPGIRPPEPAAHFTVGIFGHLRETKRIHVVIRALERTRKHGIDARLLLAGAFVSNHLALALPWQAPWISHTGALSDADFWRAAQSVDVCVNLKYPSALETSGIGVQMMGLGKPVIFSQGAELEHIPETACLRVACSPDEEQVLAGYLLWLAQNPKAARNIGRTAAEYVQREHAIGAIAKKISAVLNAA